MSDLHLYNTADRKTSKFVPLKAKEVGIYLCGATVQAPPHIGHIRSGVNFDILNRWLVASGYQVTFIRNVYKILMDLPKWIQFYKIKITCTFLL